MKTRTRTRAAALVVAALAATGLATAAPGAAAAPTIGYTTLMAQGGCWLGTIDLTTGSVSRLPAEAAPETCVNDLAASDSMVLGIVEIEDGGPILEDRAVDGPGVYLVDFDPATGAPTATEITIPGSTEDTFLANGGIAIAPDGTVYAQLVTEAPGCVDWEVCLVTLDPATAVATPIGNSGLVERTLWELALCGDALAGFARSDAGQDGRLFDVGVATTDPATGATSVGSAVASPTFGFDCAEGTAHVLSGEFPRAAREAEDYHPLAQLDLATLDLATGDVTLGTPLSTTDDINELALLAIPVQTTPEPTTTTTTAPGQPTTTTTRPTGTAGTPTAATPVMARPAYTG